MESQGCELEVHERGGCIGCVLAVLIDRGDIPSPTSRHGLRCSKMIGGPPNAASDDDNRSDEDEDADNESCDDERGS